jgi:hypothetical protein
MFMFGVIFWARIFTLLGGDGPCESKRTELPFSLNTAINLTALPMAILAILAFGCLFNH